MMVWSMTPHVETIQIVLDKPLLRAADRMARKARVNRSVFIREALREGLSGLKRTLGELPKQKSVAAFLLANMIYTDGLVSLFAFGGIYAAGTFGWHTIQIGSFGILLAIAGTFGAWLGGKLDDKLGPKRVIAGSLLILLFALAAILLVDKDSILFVKVAPPALTLLARQAFRTQQPA